MINGLTLGLAGMNRYARMFDRAAEQVVRAGMRNANPAIEAEDSGENSNAGGAVSPPDDLIRSMVDMMMAQRLFIASLHVTQAEDKMMETAVNIAAKK